MLLFLGAQFCHLLLQVVVVLDDGVFLALKSIVTIIVLTLDLGSIERQFLCLLLDAVNL